MEKVPPAISNSLPRAFISWGCDVINMTTVPEVCLAMEAGISYASVAMVTDYDCWKESEEAVNVEKVMAVLRANVDNVKGLFKEAVIRIGKGEWDAVINANEV